MILNNRILNWLGRLIIILLRWFSISYVTERYIGYGVTHLKYSDGSHSIKRRDGGYYESIRIFGDLLYSDNLPDKGSSITRSEVLTSIYSDPLHNSSLNFDALYR